MSGAKTWRPSRTGHGIRAKGEGEAGGSGGQGVPIKAERGGYALNVLRRNGESMQRRRLTLSRIKSTDVLYTRDHKGSARHEIE